MSGLLLQALLGGTAGAAKQVNDNWREKVKQAREDAIYTRGRADAQADYARNRTDAQADYARNRTDVQADYDRNRTDALSDYERQKRDTATRDDVNYTRGRADSQADYDRERTDRLTDYKTVRADAQSDYDRDRNNKLTDYDTTRKDALTDYKAKKTIDEEFKDKVPVYAFSEDGKTLVPLTPGTDGALAGLPAYRGGDKPGYLSSVTKNSSGSIGGGSSSSSSNDKGYTVTLLDGSGQVMDDIKTVPGPGNQQYVMVQVPVTDAAGKVVGSDLKYIPVQVHGQGAAPSPEPPTVTDEELSTLFEGRNNPQAIADFNKKYGQGAAERTLGALDSATQNTQPATTPAAPVIQPGAATPTPQPSPNASQAIPTFEQAQQRTSGRDFISGLFGDRAEYYAKQGDWANVAKLANPQRYQQLVAKYSGT